MLVVPVCLLYFVGEFINRTEETTAFYKYAFVCSVYLSVCATRAQWAYD